MSGPRSITIVGGSLAGLRAAETLRREGFSGDLRIISAEDRLPIDRPPLSKQVLAGMWELERAELRGASEIAASWVLGRRAVSLDVASLAVTLDDGTVLAGDGVVIACGAAPRRLPPAVLAPGTAGVYELRTVEDCLALRPALVPGARIVVIGAGFIGSEVASTASGLGCSVTIVEMLDVPLERVLGATMGARCGRLHTDNGVSLLLGAGVVSVSEGAVALEDGWVVPADAVVVGVGVAPATDWLASSGLALRDGVVCDSRCRAAPGVVACGDVARWDHPVLGSIRLEHWTNAAEQGAAAALALLYGDGAAAYRPIPYFWSDQYKTKIQFLGRNEAGDVVAVEEGSLDDDRFVVSYRRDGRLTGVLLWNRPARMPHWMSELETAWG